MHLKIWCSTEQDWIWFESLLDKETVEHLFNHDNHLFRVYCVDCDQWLYKLPVERNVAYSHLTRHAFHPNHAAESRARIRVARLNKEIGDFLGTVTEL